MNAQLDSIRDRAALLLAEIPSNVTLEAAVKKRSAQEAAAAYEGGIRIFGHNYVQEAQRMLPDITFSAQWHLIGHLQSNKASVAVDAFDMIETLDSLNLAQRLNQYCEKSGKILPVLIEVNSGREANKNGVMPEAVEALAVQISGLKNLKLDGLMTMGPLSAEERDSRPYFKTTRLIFEALSRFELSTGGMRVLSMGMSGSYRVAIDEGATIIRLGTALFGPR